jgi:hypothetical protein
MRESAALNRLRGISAALALRSGAIPRDDFDDQGFSEPLAGDVMAD